METLLERLAHLRARTVEEHPLVRHRDAKETTCFLRAHLLEIPEREDRSLTLGQAGAAGRGAIREDPEDPRLEGGPALEPGEPVQHAKPCVLDDLLRESPVAHE